MKFQMFQSTEINENGNIINAMPWRKDYDCLPEAITDLIRCAPGSEVRIHSDEHPHYVLARCGVTAFDDGWDPEWLLSHACQRLQDFLKDDFLKAHIITQHAQ